MGTTKSIMVVLVVSVIWSLGLSQGRRVAPLVDSTPQLMRGVTGMQEGLCCAAGAVLCGSPVLSGCSAPLPWQCTCANPGSGCQFLVVPPTNNAVCRARKPIPFAGDHCDLQTDFCYYWRWGVCDDDAGPWSWGGFCSTCGCADDPTHGLTGEGVRDICSATSTRC